MSLSTEQIRLNRIAALELSVKMHRGIKGDLELRLGEDRGDSLKRATREIRETASVFLAWLDGTTRITLTPGPIIDQSTGQKTGTLTFTGANMAQITDNEITSFTVATEDAKGFATPDAITFAYAPSDGSVVTSVLSTDGKTITFTAVAPGTVTGTVTDSSATDTTGNPLSASFTLDVVPAGTAKINLTQGPVTEQPAPAPGA